MVVVAAAVYAVEATDTNVVADGDVNDGADVDGMSADDTGSDDTAGAECDAEKASVAVALVVCYQMLLLLDSIQVTASVAADKIVASKIKINYYLFLFFYQIKQINSKQAKTSC